MKVLNLDEKVEQALVQICDLALKAAGINAIRSYDIIRNSIVEQTEAV